MSRAGRAQMRGRALAMAPPLGAPVGGGYKYRKFEGWSPEDGVHRDPAEVMPKDKAADYEARLAACADMTARGMTSHEISLRLEVSGSTVSEYRRTLRRRAAEADAAEAAP